MWGYLAVVGAVGVVAVAAAVTAAWVDPVVTVMTQAFMAVLIFMIYMGGGQVRAHQDQFCHDVPSAASCKDSGRTGGCCTSPRGHRRGAAGGWVHYEFYRLQGATRPRSSLRSTPL
ncbi:DUF6234 family protein [Streptomyces aureus]